MMRPIRNIVSIKCDFVTCNVHRIIPYNALLDIKSSFPLDRTGFILYT